MNLIDLERRFFSAIDRNEYETAAQLDGLHYATFVKPTENIKEWDRWQRVTHHARQNLTTKILSLIPGRLKKSCEGYFLIVHHNFSGLAHEQQLARNLRYLVRHGFQQRFQIIYLFGPRTEQALNQAKSLYGLPAENITFLCARGYLDAARRIDSHFLSEENISTIVYVTIFFMAYWVSLFLPHDNQKFLQMKYPPLQSGRIAEWGTGRSSHAEKIDQENGRWTQLGILDLLPFGIDWESPQKNSQEELHFGSISRIEKSINPEYIQFVENILDDNRHLVYLYTVRESELSTFPSTLRHHPRAKNLGWVDPRFAIRMYDIYLDTFPWGGGDMSLLALGAGVPYLSLYNNEAKRFGIQRFLRYLVSDNSILNDSFSATTDDLRKTINTYAKNFDCRKSLSNEWHRVLGDYCPEQDIRSWKNFLTG